MCAATMLFPIRLVLSVFKKFFFLPVNAQYSVLAQGYVNDASAPILELLGQYFEKSKYLRPEDYPKILEKIKQTIDLLEGA